MEYVSLRVEDSFVSPLVKEYEDIFQLLSLGLPPKREISHPIPLEKGHKLPFRPIYWLSPLEIEEAKRQIVKFLFLEFSIKMCLPFSLFALRIFQRSELQNHQKIKKIKKYIFLLQKNQ
jgi:hypothetical protein